MILGDIGDAARDEALDQRAHLRHVVGRARFVGRRQAAERCDVLVILREGLRRHLGDGLVQRQPGKSRAARALILSSTSVTLRA